MVGACGRLDFNPIGGNPNGDDDDDGHIDASFASHDAPIDALTACTNALPVQLNVRKATDTCAGGDLVDSCGPPATKEVVFAFTSPATAGYNFRAFDPGTQNVSSSLQQLDANCKPLGGCTGLLGISVAAGDTAYFVVEAAAGGCANIEFEAQ
jgi:hypothetical protein